MAHLAVQFVTLLSLCVMVLGSGLAAQATGQSGLWFRFGLAYGSLTNTGTHAGQQAAVLDGVVSGDYGAAGGFVRVGTTLGRWIRVGGGINALWSRAGDNAMATDMQLLFESYIPRFSAPPRRPSAFFVMLAPGVSHYHANSMTSVCARTFGCMTNWPAEAVGEGWSVAVGLGYEARLAGNVFLTPLLSYLYQSIGDVEAPAGRVVASDWNQHVLEMGVGVGYH